MKCIEIKDKILTPAQRPLPEPKQGEILIRVKAAGVNRPDLLQRLGLYPPPEGITDIPGLEVAGTVIKGSKKFPEGSEVCALLAGGGYADHAVAPEGQCLSKPSAWTWEEAAALPETLFTVWANLGALFLENRPRSILVHGGSSGIGSMAIMVAKQFGWQVSVTAGSDEKCAFCEKLGADQAVNYRTSAFEDQIKNVDVVLDMVGGDYLDRNLTCLAKHGRHISIAMLRGQKAEINIRTIMQKQLILTGSTLRARPIAEKTALRDQILDHLGAALNEGTIKPHIHRVFPLEQAQDAHALMEQGDHMGKIALTVDET